MSEGFHICRTCNGSGEITCPRCGGYGTFSSGETCYYCQGNKTVECPSCNGTGSVED